MQLKTQGEAILAQLIERGKRSSSLTYEEVNAALPEGVSDPERLHEILETLESNGINVIDEDEAQETGETKALSDEALAVEEDVPFSDNEGDGKHVDDPVRMYLMQMGEIPLLTRDKEISLAQTSKKLELRDVGERTQVLFNAKLGINCRKCYTQPTEVEKIIGFLKRVPQEFVPFKWTKAFAGTP